MSQNPAPVPSLLHEGVRYEAPHTNPEAEEGAARLRVITLHLEQAMRRGMTAGEPVDPQSRAWLEGALADCPVPADEIRSFLELMEFQATVAPVMMRVTQQMLSKVMPAGKLPTLEGPDLRAALEADGTLTPEQIDRVLDDITGPFAGPRPSANGGRLVALDEQSGEKLWELQVYRNDGAAEEVYVTGLDSQGEDILVRDQSGRVHRVNSVIKKVTEVIIAP